MILKKIDRIVGNKLESREKTLLINTVLPVEKICSPSVRRITNRRITANITDIRRREKKLITDVTRAIDSYETALRNYKLGKRDRRGERKNEIINAHKDFTHNLIEKVFECVIDTIQTTDSVSLKKVNKSNRGYADGYLSHYSQTINKLKELRSKL